MYGVIYKITNLINGKPYVGQTTRSIEVRFREHANCKTSFIGKAIRKYGYENFKIEILEECDTLEQLNEREKFFIAKHNCKNPNGYNLTDGGEGKVGWHPTEETRAKFSAATRGQNNPFFGKHHKKEIKAKLAIAKLGNKNALGFRHTDESKKRISLSRIGENNPFFWQTSYKRIQKFDVYCSKRNFKVSRTCSKICCRTAF